MNYCKHCGTALGMGEIKCRGCGASVDYTDGGQSYMTDAEIEMWRHKTPPNSAIPTTREVNLLGSANAKGKKRGFSLSDPKVLIAVCAIAAVTVLLLVAAIIVVIRLPKDGKEAQAEPPSTDESTDIPEVGSEKSGIEGIVADAFETMRKNNEKIIAQNNSAEGEEE